MVKAAALKSVICSWDSIGKRQYKTDCEAQSGLCEHQAAEVSCFLLSLCLPASLLVSLPNICHLKSLGETS